MVAEMTDLYEYEIHQEGRSWVVRIPALGLTTQARNLRETDRMAKSIIGLHLDRDPTSFEVRRSNIIGLPGTVAEDVKRAVEERGRLAAAQAASVSATTKAAAELIRCEMLDTCLAYPTSELPSSLAHLRMSIWMAFSLPDSRECSIRRQSTRRA
jgi:hypothetical protein